ncbi:MAG: cobyrinate a,c-diamide synthase [Holophaga sp.]|nr:cobyrinate a,c-diamide synthase [Holophaga sp.]
MTTPGFLLAGTHSGCGKSTLAAGLMRAYVQRGRVVAPFKAGPDYLDPMLHRVAAGRTSWNLDGWFLDDAGLRETWARGSAGSGLALVEGVMGLFDGADPVSFRGSGADLALRLGLPAVLVVDASGVGGSVAATVLGHARLVPGLDLAGVIFNRVASDRHYGILEAAVRAHTDVKPLGWAGALKAWRLPERHLGIFRPEELPDLEGNLQGLARDLAATLDLDALAALARAPQGIPCLPPPPPGELPVALARDAAFSFSYADTLDRLERLGVRWVPFSPLREDLPAGVAGVYLPGGYPELHAGELSRNGPFFASLRAAHAAGMPIFAECGGYMALAEALVDADGRAHPMAGLIPGRSRMAGRLQSFGYKHLTAARDTLFCAAGAEGRAHEFHHSVWDGTIASPAWACRSLGGESSLQGHAEGNLLASYAHLHFGAMPSWAETWVARMRAWQHGSC